MILLVCENTCIMDRHVCDFVVLPKSAVKAINATMFTKPACQLQMRIICGRFISILGHYNQDCL